MKNRVFIAVLAVAMFIGNMSFAQSKIGHINTQNLIEMMPEAAKIDSSLQTYAQNLQKQQAAMREEYNNKQTQFEKDMQSGDMAQSVIEARVGEIEDLGKRIQNFQQKAQQDLAMKQQELYKPLIEKVETAIDEVAQENGYKYVFESSTGNILHSPEEDNLMPLVKKKLGLE